MTMALKKEDLIIGGKYVDPDDGEEITLLSISICCKYVIYEWFDLQADTVEHFCINFIRKEDYNPTQRLQTDITRLQEDIMYKQELLKGYLEELNNNDNV
jgi:hypothetical protein